MKEDQENALAPRKLESLFIFVQVLLRRRYRRDAGPESWGSAEVLRGAWTEGANFSDLFLIAARPQHGRCLEACAAYFIHGSEAERKEEGYSVRLFGGCCDIPSHGIQRIRQNALQTNVQYYFFPFPFFFGRMRLKMNSEKTNAAWPKSRQSKTRFLW